MPSSLLLVRQGFCGSAGPPSPAEAPETIRPSGSVTRRASTQMRPVLGEVAVDDQRAPILMSPRSEPFVTMRLAHRLSQAQLTTAPFSSFTSI